MAIPTDNRGSELKVKQKVAYNYCGEIAIGQIIDIKPSTRLGRHGFRIHIKLEYPKYPSRQNHTSVITSDKNVMVIEESVFKPHSVPNPLSEEEFEQIAHNYEVLLKDPTVGEKQRLIDTVKFLNSVISDMSAEGRKETEVWKDGWNACRKQVLEISNEKKALVTWDQFEELIKECS